MPRKFASVPYNVLIKDTNIVRSMSRAGKPTDNLVNEALNGWIKEELTMNFGIDRVWGWSNIIAKLDEYIKFYNEQRPCFAIGYDDSLSKAEKSLKLDESTTIWGFATLTKVHQYNEHNSVYIISFEEYREKINDSWFFSSSLKSFLESIISQSRSTSLTG